MRFRLVIAALLSCLLAAPSLGASAQAPPTAATTLSDRQYEALVKAVTDAVRRELSAGEAPGSPATAPAPVPRDSSESIDWRGNLKVIFAAAPAIPGAAGRALAKILVPPDGGNHARHLVGIAAVLGVTALAGIAMTAAFAGMRRRMLAGAMTPGYAQRIGLLLAIDVAIRAVALGGALLTAHFWYADASAASAFLQSIATLPAWWWLTMAVAEAALRPGHRAYRLVALGDIAARRAFRAIAVLAGLRMVVVTLLPILIVHGALPVPVAQAIALISGTAAFAMAISATFWVRHGEQGQSERESTTGGFRRRAWPAVIVILATLLWLSWTYGAIAIDLSTYDSLVESIGILLLAVVLDRIVDMLERERTAMSTSVDPLAALLRAIRRSLRVCAILVVTLILLRVWAVGQFDLVTPERWSKTSPSLQSAIAAVVLGYVLWEALRFWVDQRLGPQSAGLPSEDEELEQARSRFDTLLPLLRIAGGTAIGVITTLFALSELGVNTTPLLAGASILGLAISFGSQSLVRDIVSGVFFMLDDAFRIGDYIDTGRLKGTVEGTSLRSVRLRHQSGQVHTIPFGQLQAITNFSRDWATVKFNLRLARDSDIEIVRKAVKKIGQEMLVDAELAREFIQPLKLQGVQEIDDTAIVVRCKFTVRPAKPTWVQRQALKRIHDAFPRVGIAFATQSITVHGTATDAQLQEAVARQQAASSRRPTVES